MTAANPLAFATLACPEWTPETVIERAAAYGYDALEWRGGDAGHVQPGLPTARLTALRRQQDAAGVQALSVNAYTSFVSDSAAQRQAALDHLRGHCDVAAVLGASYVRAFLNENEPVADPDRCFDRIAECLTVAANYAATLGLTIAIEPHDEFIHSATVAALLERVRHPALGAIWDIANTYSAGESLDDGYRYLRARLCYVQVKDGRGQGKAWQLTRLGEGEAPVQPAMRHLLANGYQGAFSLEWERAWHPELEPAEIALPSALKVMRSWLAET